MPIRLESLIKRVLPWSAVNALRFLLFTLPKTFGRLKTQRILAAATDHPSYLDISALKTLQMKYPPPPEYKYDAHSVEVRGKERARQLLRLPGARNADSFLELGCWDGMVSCCLCREGKKATAIDNRDVGFDERATREGVDLLIMDAADLQFDNESFDYVFSYDAFEHFVSPEDVLREAIRVVRRGGYIYLEFGPLYYSPFGEHAYRSITVPYCQFLFTKDLITDFVTQDGLEPIDFNHVNGWSLERYRGLWSTYTQLLSKVRYYESVDLSHLGLIDMYPTCFRSRSNCLDNFVVARVGVLFRRTDQECPLPSRELGQRRS
jgi:SAM-dependent methyltransferase